MKIIANFKDVLLDSEGNAIVSFKVSNIAHKHMVQSLDTTKTYSLQINEVKSKRSIEQNKYLWALISEIDVAINGKPTDEFEIYIMCLERANAKCEYIACIPEAEQTLKENFRAIKYIKKVQVASGELNMYKCFLGSSKMNVKEMNLLIETALDMAAEVGIETEYYKELLR